MKTVMNIKHILLALAVIIGLATCKDSDDPISNRVYLHEAFGLDYASLFVIPDAGTQVVVTPRIAEPLDHDLELEIYVKEDALDDYNRRYGTSYQLMDASRYKLTANRVVIPAGKVITDPVYIELDALIPDENKSGFTFALPLSVRAVDNSIPVLESAATYFYAALPVPMADVPELQKYCILQLPFSQDYELENWTFETLFNGSRFTGASNPTYLASAQGYNFSNPANPGISTGFMLRLGDAGVAGNYVNGRIQFAGKGTSQIGFKPDVWHHIAIVSANRIITVYIDGVAAYNITAPDNFPAVRFIKEQGIRLAGENRTGTNIATTTRYRYSQVRLWGEARTADQLKNNMYGVPEDSPNLLGYWKLDGYTEGQKTVNKVDNNITIDGSAETMVIDTYFFKDYTGNNPDGFVDRNPALNPGGLEFTTDRRIEIGYKYDGTKD